MNINLSKGWGLGVVGGWRHLRLVPRRYDLKLSGRNSNEFQLRRVKFPLLVEKREINLYNSIDVVMNPRGLEFWCCHKKKNNPTERELVGCCLRFVDSPKLIIIATPFAFYLHINTKVLRREIFVHNI